MTLLRFFLSVELEPAGLCRANGHSPLLITLYESTTSGILNVLLTSCPVLNKHATIYLT